MKYDDGKWHVDSVDSSNSESKRLEIACAHIVVYYKWCVINNLAVTDDEALGAELDKVKNGSMTATNYFINYCDCRLIDSDLSESGNAFSKDYYNYYLKDLDKLAKDFIYSKIAEDYPCSDIFDIIQKRYTSWKEGGKLGLKKSCGIKPWWKLW